MTIVKGTNFGGDYSRFSFNTANGELKRYFALLKEKQKSVLDDDFNFAQDALLTQIVRCVKDIFGNGSPNNGFKIVGTNATNNFTITGGDGTVGGAGVMYVAGLRVILPSDTTYSAQEAPGGALSPPGSGTRTDTVYLDVWFDEVGPADDATINDPTLAAETGRRLKLKYQVLVAAGAGAPANYTDGNGQPHYTAALATILRTTSANITAGMVTDVRQALYSGATLENLRSDIKYVVEQAALTYSEGDATQLYLAIVAIATAVAAPASQAQVNAGTDTTHPVASDTLAGAYGFAPIAVWRGVVDGVTVTTAHAAGKRGAAPSVALLSNTSGNYKYRFTFGRNVSNAIVTLTGGQGGTNAYTPVLEGAPTATYQDFSFNYNGGSDNPQANPDHVPCTITLIES